MEVVLKDTEFAAHVSTKKSIEKLILLQLFVTMMSWVRVWVELIVTLLTDSEVLVLFAEINQILLKISFIHIIETFIHLVGLDQKTEL